MAEVLVSYDMPVRDAHGVFHARALGRHAEDGMWEGWLEFIAADGSGEVLVSAVESRQPEHEHLVYWATGLTHVYLEGGLNRARRPLTVRVRTVGAPVSSAPAPRVESPKWSTVPGPEPVLDPFEVGGRNLDVLRQELGALNRPRLLNIITAFDLNPAGEPLDWMTDAQLAHFIVVAVDARMLQRARG